LLKNEKANGARLESALVRAEVRLRLLLQAYLSLSLSGGDGGADRDRTGDPLLAKQVLSQLSYSPVHGLPMNRRPVSSGAIFAPKHSSRRKSGGSGKSRTSDLTLIRGAL
jgi:hypothetical protein